MKIPVLAFYNTLAEKKHETFWNKEKLKNVFFLEKSKKNSKFQNWKKVKINCIIQFSVPNLVGLAF